MDAREFGKELINMRDEIEGLKWRGTKGKLIILGQILYSGSLLNKFHIDENLLTHLHKQLRLGVKEVMERHAENEKRR